MKQLLGGVAALALLVGAASPAAATSILYFVDGNNGTDQMAAALAASGDSVTIVSDPTVFATDLAMPGVYQLGIFSAQEAYGPNYSAALAALHTFVLGGGKAIVDSWFTPDYAADISQFGADTNGNVDQTSMTLTSFNSGVTNPVSLTNPVPPYATFSVDLSVDALNGVSAAGTFGDGSDAIVVGDAGSAIVNGFLNDTAGSPGERIYANEIGTLLRPPTVGVPEPSSLPLLGFGIMALAWLRRRMSANQA